MIRSGIYPTDRRQTCDAVSSRKWRHRIGVVLLAGGLLPIAVSQAPSVSAQSVGGLKDRARALAEELDRLDQRTNSLDEDYNSATLELSKLKEKVKANQANVAAAEKQLSVSRKHAHDVALQAYVGANNESDFIGVSDDITSDSRRRTYLGTKFNSSQEVIDTLVTAQKDLSDREAALDAAKKRVDSKVAAAAAAKKELEKVIADRKAAYDSVSGELAAALKAEQDKLARAAAKKAEADALAAQARASSVRRPAAVKVSTRRGGGTVVVAPTAPSTPRAPVTPPPSGAPTAVRVALEQQGDPYLWAAAGPDRFDCSGLIMYAYAAAGVSLPHSSRALRSMTRSISADQLQPGDLVFGGSPVHHVGMYIGNGQMVHAPHSGDVVKVSGIYSTSKPVSFGRL